MKRVLIIALTLLSLNCVCVAGVLDNIIPAPQKAELLKGSLRVGGAAVKCDPSIDSLGMVAIRRFAAKLSLVSGKTSPVSSPIGLRTSVTDGTAKGIIFLKDDSLGQEEYRISVNPKTAVVRASGSSGFMYAIQTLKQMLPESIYGSSTAEKDKWVLPCCEISDKPRFGYRGMHLDCVRHFWSTDEIRRYLDVMAMFKLNRFHWHLTDDQGWRIEIKSYPLLSRIACYREGTMTGKDFNSNDNIRYGGFYSQDEIREVVRYAASLGITVIPEIELPGHMLAALSAYPEFGCTGGPYETWTRWGISDQVLCPGKEGTFEFLEAVLTEVADLFPSEYIHIGGDECPKTEWEKCPDCQALIAELGITGDGKFTAEQYLQNHVTSRVQSFLGSLGKKIIGWDEILEGSPAAGATIMSWRGMSGAQEAAASGFDAILTPNSYCYFDYCQSENPEDEPLCIGGYVPVEKVYSLDPLDGIAEENAGHILGVQANLWTEYISTPEHLEYMLLPRMLALSEVQWCDPDMKDYSRFSRSLEEHGFKILSNAGFNYRKK